MMHRPGTDRRRLLQAGAGVLTAIVLRPALATPAMLRDTLAAFAGDAPIGEGRVALDIPPLVENGNVVPLTVSIESPMTEADHVREIAVFNERNPQPYVVRFQLGPRAGRAKVTTRMRLSTSQAVVAAARLSDGSIWSARAEVIVTLAACVES